jgi:hypothetical protein
MLKGKTMTRRIRTLIRIVFGLILFVLGNGLFFYLIYFLGMIDSMKHTQGFALTVKIFITGALYMGYLFGFAKIVLAALRAMGLEWLIENDDLTYS